MSILEPGFYWTDATLPSGSPSYVERAADSELYAALQRGEFCYVLTSRQMGKSSLMVRTAARLREDGVAVAVLDLTALGQNLSAEQWYLAMLGLLGHALDLEDALEAYWEEHTRLGPLGRWMQAVREVVLPRCPGRIVLFVDEIDAVRSLPFSTDEFFAAIRECHNRRGEDPDLASLTFCLLGVATPSDLIQDPRTTPFNIGRRIELFDFTAEEAAPLSRGLGPGEITPFSPRKRERSENAKGTENFMRKPGNQERLFPGFLPSWFPNQLSDFAFSLLSRFRGRKSEKPAAAAQPGGSQEAGPTLQRVLYWTGGHPYLTQRLCRALAEASSADPHNAIATPRRVDRLCEELFLAPGAREKDDNLLFVRDRLLRSEEDRAGLLDLYRQVWRRRRVRVDDTNPLVNLLQLAGIASVIDGRLRVRNRIYARVFDAGWVTQHMPDAELRRQRAAYRRGLLFAFTTAGIIAAVMAVLATWALRNAKRADRNANLAARRFEQARTAQEQAVLRAADAREQARRASDNERKAKEQARRADAERQTARGAQEQALRSALQADLQKRQAVTAAQSERQAKAVALGAVRRAELLLSESQAARGVRQLSDGDVLGLLYLQQACDSAAALPPVRSARAALWAKWAATCSGRLLQVLGHPGDISAMSFSPDGTLLVTLSRGKARLWETATGRLRGQPLRHEGQIGSLRFSPDGRLLLTVVKNTAQLWDTRTGRPGTRLRVGPPLQHADTIEAAAFSPRGTLLATGSRDRALQFWETATGRPGTRLRVGPPLRQPDPVHCLAFSPDGTHVATGSDHTVRLWSLSGPPRERVLGTHDEALDLVLFSPDGRLLASRSRDQVVRLWETATGQPRGSPLRPVRTGGYGGLSEVAFSADGKRLMACANGVVQLWDTATGAAHGPPLGGQDYFGFGSVALSPDGSLLAAAPMSMNGTVQLWETASGKPRRAPLEHHGAGVSQVAFSPDGQLLATGSIIGTAWLWDTATWQHHGPPLRYQGAVSHLLFSPDGRRLAIASIDKSVRLWATQINAEPRQTVRHPAPIGDVAFSPEGKRLATASADQTARLWDTASGRPRCAPLPHPGPVDGVAFSPDGRLLATLSGGRLQLWEAATGKRRGPSRPYQLSSLVETAPFAGPAAVFSPDGRLVISATGQTIRLWETATGRPQGPPLRVEGTMCSVTFSPDGRLLAAATSLGRVLASPFTRAKRTLTLADLLSGTVWLWETRTGRPVGKPWQAGGTISSIAFSPDSQRLATATAINVAPGGVLEISSVRPEGVVRLWSLKGEPRGPVMRHPEMITGLTYSPDGKLLATISGSLVRLWETGTGRVRGGPLQHSGPVGRVLFSPDGKLLATTAQDGAVHLWDTSAAQAYGEPMRHSKRATVVCFSADSRSLATAGEDGSASLWRLPSPPADVREIATRTWVALGAQLDAHGEVQAIPPAEWVRLREHLQEQSAGRTTLDGPGERAAPPSTGGAEDSWWAWMERGRTAARQGLWNAAIDAYSTARRRGANDWVLWSARGDAHAARGTREKAIADYRQALWCGADYPAVWYHTAVLQVAQGDLTGYRNTCAEMLNRYSATQDAGAAVWVAWTCSLAPQAVLDLGPALRLAEKEAAGQILQNNAGLTGVAGLLYRAGRFEAALQRLNTATSILYRGGSPTDWFLLAMTHHRLRHDSEARQWLARGATWVDQAEQRQASAPPDQKMDWSSLLQLQLLRREAEALLQPARASDDGPGGRSSTSTSTSRRTAY